MAVHYNQLTCARGFANPNLEIFREGMPCVQNEQFGEAVKFLAGRLLELITQTPTNLPHNTLAIVPVLP